jgi:hypothetical protein
MCIKQKRGSVRPNSEIFLRGRTNDDNYAWGRARALMLWCTVWDRPFIQVCVAHRMGCVSQLPQKDGPLWRLCPLRLDPPYVGGWENRLRSQILYRRGSMLYRRRERAMIRHTWIYT